MIFLHPSVALHFPPLTGLSLLVGPNHFIPLMHFQQDLIPGSNQRMFFIDSALERLVYGNDALGWVYFVTEPLEIIT